MPRTQVFIPLSKGLDQKLDERLREPDSLAQATNAYYRRNNGLTKRHGFSPLTTNGYVHDGASKGLLSTGEELLIRGYRRLFALAEGNAEANPEWVAKGDVSPFAGAQRTVFSDALSVPSSDCAHNGGYTVHAASTMRFAGSLPGAGLATQLVYKVETEHAPNEIKGTTILASDNGPTLEIGAARTVPGSAAGGVSVVHIGCARFATTALQWYRWSSAAPTAVPPLVISHLDMYTVPLGDSGNDRRYDATALGDWPTGASGQWAYCYVRLNPVGSRNIYVARMFDGVTLASWLVPSPLGQEWEYCAIADGPIAGQIYVVGVDNAANTWLFSYTQNGAPNWSRLMHGSSTGGGVNGCSVVEGTQNAVNLVLVATNSATPGLPQQFNLDMSASDPTGASGSVRTVTRNVYGLSKPWNFGGRFYIAARVRYGQGSTVGQLNYDNGYCAEVVFDAFSSPTTANLPAPRLVARYDFGVVPSYSAQVPSQEYTFTRGSMQSVQVGMTDVNVCRYATQRITASVAYKFPTLAGDVVSLDFAAKVTQDATTRGSATFGGANVAWYTGQGVCELGFSSGPVIASITSANDVNATLVGGTYTYRGVLESYDERGNLTRSVPGPTCLYTVPGGGGTHHVDVQVYTVGASQRYDSAKRFAVVLYRADQDGVFQRCTQPFVNSFDQQTSQFFPTIRDMGEQYDAIYTQSGAEVEASGPDGAAFVMVGTKRVWLAGFFRRDRIQYSKLYNPATANEFAIAPEFNDAFAYLLPGGEQVTALGELDDKVVIFTAGKIFAIAGNGPDDGGRGNDFSGLQLVSSDTGCIDARSIVETPAGIFFQASAGIYVLGRDLQINFAGASVRDITDAFQECTSAVLVPADNHVRFTLRDGVSGLVLVYDFDQGAWSRWDVRRIIGAAQVTLDPVGACLHRGAYHVLAHDGRVYKEDATTYFDSATIYVPMTVETGWLQATQQSGWQRIRQVAAMCGQNDEHQLTISLYQDFDGSTPTQTQTYAEATIAAQKLQELEVMRVKQQKCTAFKVRIQDAASAGTTTGQGYDCMGFSVELTGKRGLYKPGPQQRN